MADTLQLIASIEWIALGVLVLWRLRWWNKKFSEMYEELKADVTDINVGNK